MNTPSEHMQRAFERAEDQLHDDLAEGRITQAEFNAEIRAMGREYREAAEEAARDAYDREREQW